MGIKPSKLGSWRNCNSPPSWNKAPFGIVTPTDHHSSDVAVRLLRFIWPLENNLHLITLLLIRMCDVLLASLMEVWGITGLVPLPNKSRRRSSFLVKQYAKNIFSQAEKFIPR